MHGADWSAEQVFPLPLIFPTQQSFDVRPGPRLEQPEPPHVPQADTQHTPSASTPTYPLLQVGPTGAGVGAGVGTRMGAGVGSIFAGVGAGVGSPVHRFAKFTGNVQGLPTCNKTILSGYRWKTLRPPRVSGKQLPL